MQRLDDRFVYSATDLNNFLECGHLLALEREVAYGRLVRPERDESAVLIAEKGEAHERAYLERERELYGGVVEIASERSGAEGIRAAVAATEAAMAAGARVIYQGTFFDGTFLGKSDFLFRVETPSARWPWSYEVADTKLALSEKPYFIVQLSHYSEHVARVQGTQPAFMRVVLGDFRVKRYRVDDFAAYYRRLKAAFLDRGALGDAYPLAVPHCAVCAWSEGCEARREADDHLSLVAWMRGDQIAKFEANGIATLEALASWGAVRPAAMAEPTFARLHRQARLQHHGRVTGSHHYELLDHAPTIGFGLLPPPAEGDVFFDMEGDPLFEIGTGLEYLFGLYVPGDAVPFKAFWGTDRAGEKRAFEACVDFLIERRRRYPSMHVYHYAPYEKTKLQALWQRHASRETEVDDLLRGHVLVDLYAVVRQTLAISQPSYSIKKLEAYYGLARKATVRKGDDSVVMFERWLADPVRRDILADIERYNEEDCISTWKLRDWLLERRAEYGATRSLEPAFREVKALGDPCHDPSDPENCRDCRKRERDRAEESKIAEDAKALLARPDPYAHLLAHLMSYHRREEKPGWWTYFRRFENVDELVDADRKALGGLRYADDIAPEPRPAKYVAYAYRFPEQLHQFEEGDSPQDAATRKSAGKILRIDGDSNVIVLQRKMPIDQARELTAIVPGGPVVADEQKAALGRVGSAYLDGSFMRLHRAASDLLARSLPHLRDRPFGAVIQPDVVSVGRVLDIVRALDRSYLVIQGPPGSGKTFTGARVITQLVLEGKRVGVMAQGHKVMHNLLRAIEAYAQSEGIPRSSLAAVHKFSASNIGSEYVSRLEDPYVRGASKAEAVEAGNENLISGNGWLFSRPAMVDRLDYLFIDEAGQMSLAETLAVAPSAGNLVLLGDPQQLAHVRQGVHLGAAGDSVLEHVLGDALTIPPERGILLDVSYRMQPDLCAFVSHNSYEGRLHAAPSTERNQVRSGARTMRGLRFMAVEHLGNAVESEEEAQAIAREVGALLGGTFERDGDAPRPLEPRHILVVTPYNAQRRRIAAALAAAGHAGVAVGTVDKFQGQEAPVVFYSMAASSAEDAPRGIDFLFDANRFNVAISRAQCLAVLVASPRLFEARCRTVAQMAMVNTVCAFVERA